MATVTFTDGANSGNLALDAQYSSTPGAGDSIVVSQGSKDLTGDTTGLTNIPLNWTLRFGVDACQARKLGTVATAAKFEAPSGVLKIDGNGWLTYAHIAAGTGGSAVGTLKVSGVATVNISAGEFTSMEFGGCGSVYIGASATYSASLRMTQGTTVIEELASTKGTFTLICPGCLLKTARGMANASTTIVNGSLVMTETASNGNSSSKIMISGEFQPQSSGTIYNQEPLPGGRVSLAGCVQNQTWTGLRPHPGSVVERSKTGVTITITGEDSVP